MFTPVLTKMHWQRPFLSKRLYQLVSGYFQIGSLHFKSAFSYEAEGEFEGFQYLIKRTGMFKHKVDVLDRETDGVLAKAETTWGKSGKLLLGQRRCEWVWDSLRKTIEIRELSGRKLAGFSYNAMQKNPELDFGDNLLSEEHRGIVAILFMYLLALFGLK